LIFPLQKPISTDISKRLRRKRRKTAITKQGKKQGEFIRRAAPSRTIKKLPLTAENQPDAGGKIHLIDFVFDKIYIRKNINKNFTLVRRCFARGETRESPAERGGFKFKA
jgi:hypothetical protein